MQILSPFCQIGLQLVFFYIPIRCCTYSENPIAFVPNYWEVLKLIFVCCLGQIYLIRWKAYLCIWVKLRWPSTKQHEKDILFGLDPVSAPFMLSLWNTSDLEIMNLQHKVWFIYTRRLMLVFLVGYLFLWIMYDFLTFLLSAAQI